MIRLKKLNVKILILFIFSIWLHIYLFKGSFIINQFINLFILSFFLHHTWRKIYSRVFAIINLGTKQLLYYWRSSFSLLELCELQLLTSIPKNISQHETGSHLNTSLDSKHIHILGVVWIVWTHPDYWVCMQNRL